VQVPGETRGGTASLQHERAEAEDRVSQWPAPRERGDERTGRTAFPEITAQLPDVRFDTRYPIAAEHCRDDQRRGSVISRSAAAGRRLLAIVVPHVHRE